MSDQGKRCTLPLPVESAGGLLSVLPIMRTAIREEARVESLAMQLATILGPRLNIGFKEVKRREQVFVDAAVSGTHLLGAPHIAALESVLDDVRAGRLR